MRAKKKKSSRMPLSDNHAHHLKKNVNEVYKTQHQFLGMPCYLPNNQQAVTSSAFSAAHGA
jgi:hypothetical protein